MVSISGAPDTGSKPPRSRKIKDTRKRYASMHVFEV